MTTRPPDGLGSLETSGPLTPPASDGFCPAPIASGGQTDAQPPKHVTLLAPSGTNTYSVRPCPLTSTEPTPGSVFVESATAEAAGAVGVVFGVVAAGVGAVELVLLLLPQAAASRASRLISNAADLLTL